MISVSGRKRLLMTAAILSYPITSAAASAQDTVALNVTAEPTDPSTQVQGQDVGNSSDGAEGASSLSGYGDIIVTAQKRASNIQDVPLSVAAIAGEALENKGVENILDIAQITPGVAVSTAGPGLSQIIVRGISSTSGNQATTGLYIDEVPISVLSQNAEASLFDLDRVEVLRGPQGTLYGSSAMGGAIKYITNQPNSRETLVRGEVTVSQTHGGGTNGAINGVVNLPIIEDRAALRVTGFYKAEDGYIDRYSIDPNNYLAADPLVPPDKNVNSYKFWGVRAAIRLDPTDSLRITPSLYYQKLSSDGLFSFDDPPGSYDRHIQTRMTAEPSNDELTIYNLTAVLAVSSAIDLTSSSSYFVRDRSFSEDQSRLQFVLHDLYFPGVQPTVYPQYQVQEDKTKVFSQEVRLGGRVGPIDFVVGAYYQRNKTRFFQDFPFMEGWRETYGEDLYLDSNTLYMGDTDRTTEEKALFGQATWHLSDKLRATAGLRGFKFRQDLHTVSDGLYNGGPRVVSFGARSKGLTPKFSVDYDVSPDVLVYANAAKGFRAGGAQGPVPEAVCKPFLAELGYSSSPSSYEPDSLWSYEVGGKTQWAQRRVTVNAAAYHIDWSKIQQRVELLCGFPFTANFGKAISRGVELETSWRVTRNLSLGINGGYNDAHITEAAPGTRTEKGDRLLNVPKYTLSATVDYQRPVSSSVRAFFAGSFSYVSGVVSEYDPESNWRTRPGYEVVDVRAGLESIDDRWRIGVFAKNLLNKSYTPGIQYPATGLPWPTFRMISVSRPRTIGVNLKGKF